MWEKIKAFFSNKVVITVEGIVTAVAVAGLAIGGIDVAVEIPNIVKVVLIALGGIEALITIIQGLSKK